MEKFFINNYKKNDTKSKSSLIGLSKTSKMNDNNKSIKFKSQYKSRILKYPLNKDVFFQTVL